MCEQKHNKFSDALHEFLAYSGLEDHFSPLCCSVNIDAMLLVISNTALATRAGKVIGVGVHVCLWTKSFF